MRISELTGKYDPITLYRGVSAYQKGSNWYTPDKEWARQFTQSGRDSEIKTLEMSRHRIYRHDPLPKAYGFDHGEVDDVIEKAAKEGYSAVWMDEGHGQPDSVFLIPMAIRRKVKESMKINELRKYQKGPWKKFKHPTATDKPEKYVGGWEEYTEPQGIGAKQDPKVTKGTKSTSIKKRKKSQLENSHPFIDIAQEKLFDKYPGATVNLVPISNNLVLLDLIYVYPALEGQGIGTKAVKLLTQLARKHGVTIKIYPISDLVGWYEKLGFQGSEAEWDEGKYVDDEGAYMLFEASIGPLVTRGDTGTGGHGTPTVPPKDYIGHEVINPPEEFPPHRDAPTSFVKKQVQKLNTDSRPLNEMVRRPLSNEFTVDYEVKDGEDIVGIGKVTGGKIEMLSVRNDIQNESFAGNILSRLVVTIVRDADLANANLSIKLTDSEDISTKRFLERFGFRETGDGILKRNAGSIHPPSVTMS